MTLSSVGRSRIRSTCVHRICGVEFSLRDVRSGDLVPAPKVPNDGELDADGEESGHSGPNYPDDDVAAVQGGPRGAPPSDA